MEYELKMLIHIFKVKELLKDGSITEDEAYHFLHSLN